MSTPENEGVSPEDGGTPNGFEIAVERYQIPNIFTLNLQEERILYLYGDVVVRDFIPPHPKADDEERRQYEVFQARKIRNPDFKRAVAYIAYRRRHPEVDDGDILKAVDEINAIQLDLALLQGDDDSPPAQSSQNEQPPPSETSEPTSSTGSGSPSTETSAQVVEIPRRTGTLESDTSSPGALPTEQAS